MVTVIIKGKLTEDGRIEAELPQGWQPGEVSIEVSVESGSEWTDEELDELMQPQPQSGSEIATADEIGAWADMGIEDSVVFVEEMRRKRRERKQW